MYNSQIFSRTWSILNMFSCLNMIIRPKRAFPIRLLKPNPHYRLRIKSGDKNDEQWHREYTSQNMLWKV